MEYEESEESEKEFDEEFDEESEGKSESDMFPLSSNSSLEFDSNSALLSLSSDEFDGEFDEESEAFDSNSARFDRFALRDVTGFPFPGDFDAIPAGFALVFRGLAGTAGICLLVQSIKDWLLWRVLRIHRSTISSPARGIKSRY